jgi:uncharacterized protein (TIGR03435 family)
MRMRKRPAAAMVVVAVTTYFAVLNVPSVLAQPRQGKSENTPKLEFEVASVRLSGPIEAGATETMRISGGPGTDDPERITYSRVAMRYLISEAYGVGLDQILGPEWVITGRSPYGRYSDPRGSAPFDISAKVPPGTTKDQVGEMLQNLLAERLQLAVHRVTKELSGYTLVMSKGGSKLKESAGPPTGAEETKPPTSGGLSMELEKDGFPRLFPERNMGGYYEGEFPRRNLDGPDDGESVRIRFRDYVLFDLAQQLSSALAARVVDKTGMTGKYDFTLKFELPRNAFMVGFGVISPLATRGQAWRGTTNPPAPPQVEAVAIISEAMEKQLGLRLEAAKIPMDTLVIDHVEKTPTDN